MGASLGPRNRDISTPEQSGDQISVAAVGNAIARNGRAALALALALGSAAGVYAMTRPTMYTSLALFKPELQQPQSQVLAGVASQLGFVLPLGSANTSPETYAALASSREVLLPVVQSAYSYHVGPGVVRSTLIDVYSPRRAVFGKRRDAAIRMLAKQVHTTVLKTGSIALKVTTPFPELSQQVTGRIIDEIDSLQLHLQQGRAAHERQFTEGQLAIAAADLRAAENRLAAFLAANRRFDTPQLALDRERLTREVAMRQQLYTALADAYQKARIESVRDMPVIAVLEAPELPYAPDSRRLIFRVAVGLALGAILGLLLGFLRDTWRHLRSLPAAGARDAAGSAQEARPQPGLVATGRAAGGSAS